MMEASNEQIGQFLSIRFDALRHRESALLVGTRLGATCFGTTYLLLSVVPQLISAFSAQWMSGWLTLMLKYVGGIFLLTVMTVIFFAILMRLVARSQASLDTAKLWFKRGFLVGAIIGSSLSFWDAYAPRSVGPFSTWAMFSEEIARAAMYAGLGTAVVATLAGAVIANSRQAARDQAEASKRATEPWEEQLQASCDRRLAHDENNEHRPLQFGIARMLILTTAAACLIAIPNIVERTFRGAIDHSRTHLLETRTSEQVEQLYAHYSLGVKVSVVTVSIFIAPYIAWVILRGPDSFRRMTVALANWRRLRREGGLKHVYAELNQRLDTEHDVGV